MYVGDALGASTDKVALGATFNLTGGFGITVPRHWMVPLVIGSNLSRVNSIFQRASWI